MTDEQAENVMELLLAGFSYVVEKIPPATTELYLAYFKILPYDLGKKVILKLIENNHRFPLIADIKEAAQSFVKRDAGIPTAEEAWEEVRKKLDPFKAQIWSHPLIERTVKTIGYRNLCYSETPGADMARFLKIYDSYRKREIDIIQNERINKLAGGVIKLLG